MTHKRLGFMQLAIICGFCLFYAYYLISFFGFFMFATQHASFTELHGGQILFFATSIVASGACLIHFRRANSTALGHARFLYLASLALGSTLPTCIVIGETGTPVGAALFYVTCALSGVSIGINFMLWEDLSTHGYLNRGVLAHGTIFSAGGIIFLAGTFLLSNLGNAIVAELCLCVSTALFAFIASRCDNLEGKPVQPSIAFFRTSRHLDIVVAVINIAFGYAFIMMYQQDEFMLLIAMGIAIAVDLCFSIVFGRGRWIMFVGALRIFAAVVSCALILYCCLGEPSESIALCIVIVFWFVFRTVNGGSLTDLANRSGFSALYTGTRGKLASNIGFTLGLGLGVAVLGTGSPELQTTYIPLALVAAFILAALFLLPFDAGSSTVGYKTLVLTKMHESPDAIMEQACEAAAKQFKLSPRETEVLGILVKGRNAKYISEKLFISESTAKTHISNIYRKVGVHSQQKLLDALEGID